MASGERKQPQFFKEQNTHVLDLANAVNQIPYDNQVQPHYYKSVQQEAIRAGHEI